ncbi:hypothetical protein PITCH_A840009 [uncultured Desulfobacterium sp.]|uniref:Uncharacterized protein n=1 Tax=uncultured Desulfobacterium sp. TaxID=201089 RepID=A0A445N364_9BACT|nr:hypothetical protein PITCH_A840009 [uncultured Desulfobacterium sp.]
MLKVMSCSAHSHREQDNILLKSGIYLYYKSRIYLHTLYFIRAAKPQDLDNSLNLFYF